MFQEGDDPAARRAFQEIARVTGGAYGAFNAGVGGAARGAAEGGGVLCRGRPGGAGSARARESVRPGRCCNRCAAEENEIDGRGLRAFGGAAGRPAAQLPRCPSSKEVSMPTFIAGLLLLYLILAAIRRFGRMTPGEAARLVRKGARRAGAGGHGAGAVSRPLRPAGPAGERVSRPFRRRGQPIRRRLPQRRRRLAAAGARRCAARRSRCGSTSKAAR